MCISQSGRSHFGRGVAIEQTLSGAKSHRELSVGFSKTLRGLAFITMAAALAACQSNGPEGGVRTASDGTLPPPPTEKVKESDLRGYCPAVTLREGTASFHSYAKGGEGDPAKLRYQASISDVTRSCKRDNGMLNITVAIAGRIVPGSSGSPGTVTMPIRIVMLEGDNVVYSQLHKHEVAVGTVATQFIFSDPGLSVPEPSQRNFRILAGYDEGPPQQTARAR